MLNVNDLRASLKATYFADMEKCRNAGAGWALLHLTVCMPDVCAALASVNGRATEKRYMAWCSRFLQDRRLTPVERYGMRCTVLHQAQAKTQGQAAQRYSSWAWGQPVGSYSDHFRAGAGGKTMHIDVHMFASEMESAVTVWTNELEANPVSPEALNVATNFGLLVKVTHHVVEPQKGMGNIGMLKTN